MATRKLTAAEITPATEFKATRTGKAEALKPEVKAEDGNVNALAVTLKVRESQDRDADIVAAVLNGTPRKKGPRRGDRW